MSNICFRFGYRKGESWEEAYEKISGPDQVDANVIDLPGIVDDESGRVTLGQFP